MTQAGTADTQRIEDEPAAGHAGRVETHGIDHIPDAERRGRPRSLFAVWAASNLTYLYIVLGGTLILLGLNAWQALGVVVAGNLFWALVGWLSISGPSAGTPSAVVTRAMFGVRGNRVYNVLLGWGVGVAYEAVNLSIGALAGFALVEQWGGHAGTAVKVIVVLATALITFTISVFGHATIMRLSGWFAWILLACIVVLGYYVLRNANLGYRTPHEYAVHGLYLLGGTRQLTPATQGIESLLLYAGEYGTQKYPGDQWGNAWGLTGSRIVVDPDADWTVFGFRGIQQEFDASWDAFADRVAHPVFTSKSLAVVKARLLAAIHAGNDDPDGYAVTFADSIAFAGQPYGLRPDGTEASLRSLDSALVTQYAATQLVKSRMLLVVVGNISRERVTAAVARSLASLPAGSYTWTLPPSPPDFPSTVNLAWRVIPTNYLVGMFRGPDADSPESPAFRVALALLSSGMRNAIRERRGLSYAASAEYVERGATSGMIYVSSAEPRAVLPLMAREIETVRRLPPYMGLDLHDFTDSFIVGYFSDNSTNAAQADFLARAQLYQGDFRKAGDAMENLRHVSEDNVRDAAKKYFRDIHFVYVGDTTQVRRADFDTLGVASLPGASFRH